MHTCGKYIYLYLNYCKGSFVPVHRTLLVPLALAYVMFLELIISRPDPQTAMNVAFSSPGPHLYQHQTLPIVINSELCTGFSL